MFYDPLQLIYFVKASADSNRSIDRCWSLCSIKTVAPIRPHMFRVSAVGVLRSQVIAIDVDDPLAKELHDISDVEEKLPGHVSGIREWFRWYKTPDDKPLNAFGFGEKALSKARAKFPRCFGWFVMLEIPSWCSGSVGWAYTDTSVALGNGQM